MANSCLRQPPNLVASGAQAGIEFTVFATDKFRSKPSNRNCGLARIGAIAAGGSDNSCQGPALSPQVKASVSRAEPYWGRDLELRNVRTSHRPNLSWRWLAEELDVSIETALFKHFVII